MGAPWEAEIAVPKFSCRPEPKAGAEHKRKGSALMKVMHFHGGASAAQSGRCCPRRAGLGADAKVPSCTACMPPLTSAPLLSSPSTPPGPGLQ